MLLMLQQVQAANISSVTNNQEAAQFMRHLTGNEMFDFNSKIMPKSMLIHSLKCNYPSHSVASGWLYRVSLDQIEISDYSNEQLQELMIGTITIEFGGTLKDEVRISTTPL